MEIDAATLFNYLGKRYEEAYIGSYNLKEMVNIAMKGLKPGSRVLDVGCGTGRPVAEMLANAGHDVYGIDVAEEMVKIASDQVRGTFQQADMRTYKPSQPMDAVFAVYSLYQISPSDIYSLVYRFSEWLRDGGILVLGSTPSTSLQSGEGRYDPVWGCVRGIVKPWMTRTTKETLLSEEGWQSLLESAGFSIQAEKAFKYTPNDQDHRVTEVHYLIVARKTVSQPLFAPYPLPRSCPGARSHHDPTWRYLLDRLVFDEGRELVLDSLKHSQKTLDVGGGFCCTSVMSCSDEPADMSTLALVANSSTPKAIESIPTLSQTLPFPDKCFDSAVAMLTLDFVNDPKKSLQELTRVVDSSTTSSRIVIAQGAPENECLKLMNSLCVPRSAERPQHNHQGYLLLTAEQVMFEMGFGAVSVHRVDSHYEFNSKGDEAAKALAGLWYHDDPGYGKMKTALVPHVQDLFDDHKNVLRNELVVLVAQPTPN